jgi:hypothetical protein
MVNRSIEPPVADLLREYRQFETLRPIFIGGVRRSGTTLLHRMLDGHPRLLVYPLEDCIVRDSFFENRVFQLHELHGLLESGNAKAVLAYMTSNPKLALALESRIDTSDAALSRRHLHLGRSEVLDNQVDSDLFEHSFIETFRALDSREWTVAEVLRMWMFSFFYACNVRGMSTYVAWVTKCPDEGRCFPLYTRLFPDCRVIHLIRDPRGFYASESRKADSVKPGPPDRRIRQAAELWAAGLVNLREADRVAHGRSLSIRYEDLLKNPENTMRTVADFVQVDYCDSLLQPTFRGRPWGANTSFQTQSPMDGRLLADRASHWKRTLTEEERYLLEEMFYGDMVSLGYMSRIGGWSWWARVRLLRSISGFAGRLMAAARSLVASVRRSQQPPLPYLRGIVRRVRSMVRKLRAAWSEMPYQLASHGMPLRKNEARLLALRDAHRGQRAFVIGGGPSLSQTDVRRLKGEITIGSNALFLLFDEMSFLPTYYTVEDVLVAEDRADVINTIRGTTKVFPQDLAYCLRPDEDTVYVNFLRHYSTQPFNFSADLVRRAFWGGTVTYLNLQLAYYLGCREVYLIGIDHNYEPPAREDQVEGTVITSRSTDVNHFHPDYFGPGYRWHDPKVDRMEMAYRQAKRFFEENGGIIYNASARTKLEVFPCVRYDDVVGPCDESTHLWAPRVEST